MVSWRWVGAGHGGWGKMHQVGAMWARACCIQVPLPWPVLAGPAGGQLACFALLLRIPKIQAQSRQKAYFNSGLASRLRPLAGE